MGREMKLLTSSKVNLFLRVLGARRDGYHEVETILHTVGLNDEIEIVPTTSREVEVAMRFAEGVTGDLPSTEENLVFRAATSLLDRGARNDGIVIRLVKRIPVGAGLGGGSGNAAGALTALSRHWGLEVPSGEMLGLAAALGSDVPYCLQGGAALATGRGEKLTHLTDSLSGWFVLGISSLPLPTRDVYAAWDQSGRQTASTPAAMTLALGAGDLNEVASLLHNDLEGPAFELRPELPAKKEALLRAGATGSLLSGSGPTLFGLCATEEQACAVAEKVRADFDRVEVVPSRDNCVEILAEAAA